MYQMRKMFVKKCFWIVVCILIETGDKIWINIILPVTCCGYIRHLLWWSSHGAIIHWWQGVLMWWWQWIRWWHWMSGWHLMWWRRCCLDSRIRTWCCATITEGCWICQRWNIWKWHRIENSIIWITLFLFFLQIFFEFCSSILKNMLISLNSTLNLAVKLNRITAVNYCSRCKLIMCNYLEPNGDLLRSDI